MLTRISTTLALLLASVAQAETHKLPLVHEQGRTEIYEEPCDLKVEESRITVREFKKRPFSQELKVAKQIQYKDLSLRHDDYRQENGQPYTTFLSEKQSGLNHVKQQIWIYYAKDGSIDWTIAIQETRPTIGRTETSMVTCLF